MTPVKRNPKGPQILVKILNFLMAITLSLSIALITKLILSK